MSSAYKMKAQVLKQFEIGPTTTIDRAPLPATSWWVLLVNKTDHQIDHVRVNGGQWSAINPPIGRTCSSGESDDSCIKEQRWVPLASVTCNQNFSVEIAWPIAGGQWQTAVSNGNHADCNNYAGGVIVLG